VAAEERHRGGHDGQTDECRAERHTEHVHGEPPHVRMIRMLTSNVGATPANGRSYLAAGTLSS
jgi:hypothetical protein